MPSVLTNVGRTKLASATPENQLLITHVAVGDGGGSTPVISPSMTTLVNEKARVGASQPIRTSQGNVIIFEGFIPADVGGFTIREAAIFDNTGAMIAIGTTSVIEKQLPETGNAISVNMRIQVMLDNASQIDLIVSDQGIIDHEGLTNRDHSGAHPASSITTAELPNLEQPSADVQTVLAALEDTAVTPKQTSTSDKTTGSVLLNGAHGLGGIAIVNNNWNIIDVSGFYINSSNTATGIPSNTAGINLLHIQNGTSATQVAFNPSTADPKTWRRFKAGTTWGAWKIIADNPVQSNLSDSTVGSIMLNGAHGLGGTAIQSNNWNDIVITGFYTNVNTTQAELPLAAANLTMIHTEYGGNATQIAMRSSNTNPQTWRRSRTGSTWGRWVELYDDASNDMVGSVATFITTVTPNGYIKANGAAVSRTAYQRLFNKVGTFWGAGDGSTTFNVPDLRGYFPRFWDDSRGIDSGRSFGSFQEDLIKSHDHNRNPDGSLESVVLPDGGVNSGDIQGPTVRMKQFSKTGLTGGTETRPKNVALVAWIKY